MKNLNKLQTLLGTLLLFLSFYLSFIIHYNHFYEVMLLGIFLILYPFTKNKFNLNIYFKLYLFFFLITGLLADLIFGVLLGEVWYYNYNSIFEYILLYLFIYPFGGLVMIKSFLIFYKDKTYSKVKIPLNYLKIGSLASFLILILFLLLKYLYNVKYSGFFLASFIWIFLFFYLNYLCEGQNRTSFIRILINNPKRTIFAILLGTYINAILHEFPNLYSNQWVYQNIIFENISLFGIPVIVLVGWLALTIVPVSAYFLLFNKEEMIK